MKALLDRLLNDILPRFTTEEVALRLKPDHPGNAWDDYDVIGPVDELPAGVVIDGIATAEVLVAFGFGITYLIRNFRHADI